MKKIILVLLLSLPTALMAQGIGIRLDGGFSWAHGGGLDIARPGIRSAVQPQGGAGVFYTISPRFRAGLDYSFTRMVREEVDGTLTQLPDGSSEGELFRDLKSHFHGASLSAEYNLLGDGPLSLYVGTGAGCLFAVGNTYTIAVSNTVKPDNTGNTIHLTGHNVGHKYAVPFIPATLSLEFTFLPQVSVSFNGGYRLILAGKQDYSPKGQAYAQVGLRFNLTK